MQNVHTFGSTSRNLFCRNKITNKNGYFKISYLKSVVKHRYVIKSQRMFIEAIFVVEKTKNKKHLNVQQSRNYWISYGISIKQNQSNYHQTNELDRYLMNWKEVLQYSSHDITCLLLPSWILPVRQKACCGFHLGDTNILVTDLAAPTGTLLTFKLLSPTPDT